MLRYAPCNKLRHFEFIQFYQVYAVDPPQIEFRDQKRFTESWIKIYINFGIRDHLKGQGLGWGWDPALYIPSKN